MNARQIVFTVVGSILLIALIYVLSSFTHIDKHELGYTFNRFDGEITKLDRTGLIYRDAIKYSVHKKDLRPYQIRITANIDIGERILNAKLVKFNPDGLDQFIEWHGRKAGSTRNELKEILKCYAFAADGGASCPFLIVEAEIEPTQGIESNH